MAGLHQQLGVGAHERDRHLHVVAVGQHEVRVVAEDLDHREDVVPAAGVQPVRMLTERVDDLRHLERGRERLDQHGGADQARGQAERLTREREDVVPERRLLVVLHLRQIEVEPLVPLGEPLAAVERVQAEVHERARHGLAVDRDVLLGQVPAARADEQRRRVVDQLVVLALGRVVRDRPLDGVDQVQVTLDLVLPGGGVGVLEVGHEALGAAVERVDHELAVGRAGDLRAPVLVVGPGRRDLPVAVADLGRLLQEPGRLAALLAGRQQLGAAGAEAFLQLADEGDRLVGQDLGGGLGRGRGGLRFAHGFTPRRDMSSRVIGW